MEGTIWGCDGEFISAPRLDDLQCAFTSTMALLNSESGRCIPVVAVFDNEEVGSGTKQGAGSTFLYDILRRINRSLGRTEEEYLTSLASSFMVSADNGHAVHPNYADKTEPNKPHILKRRSCDQNTVQTRNTQQTLFPLQLCAASASAQVFRIRSS